MNPSDVWKLEGLSSLLATSMDSTCSCHCSIITGTVVRRGNLLVLMPHPDYRFPQRKKGDDSGAFLNHCRVSRSQPAIAEPAKKMKTLACGKPGPPYSGSRPLVSGKRMAARPAIQ